jgi:hypothetical protein
VTGEQWFELWMTVIATLGGGLVTLAGVGVGFLYARRLEKQKRWQDDVTFWIDELSTVYRDALRSAPSTQEEAGALQGKMTVELLTLFKSRPCPRQTIGDVVQMSITSGIFASFWTGGAVTEDTTWEEFQQQLAEVQARADGADVDYISGLGAMLRVLNDTIELLQSWRDKGVNQAAINRAQITRMQQLGMTRIPDQRKTGPSSWHGGWV